MVRAAVATKVKKKPGDFKRPKRKVGRRAPQAANVTSVGISSRRINLLEQSVLQDKGDAATTRRNLTLQDLLAQVAHYNPHMRQRALQGLRELAAQPSAASNVLANVSVLLERFLPTFVDEEAVVRDAAVSAWKALLTVLVDGKSLSPFAALITVYFCSGLTHLQVGVRRDTLRAIGALLDAAPGLVCNEAGTENLGRLIENFKDLIGAAQAQGIKVKNSYNLLNAETGGNSKKAKSKKAVSSGLALRFQGLTVLHKLLSSMKAFNSGPDDITSNVRQSRSCSVQATRTLLLYAPPRLVTAQTSSGPSNSQFWQEKSRSLLKPLLDLWLECLENEVVDTLAEDYVEHLHYVVECVELITSSNVDYLVTLDAKQSLMKTVLRLQDELLLQRFPMFPSAMLANENDPSMARWFVMNVALSKFACVFLSSPNWTTAPERPELETRVRKFVISTLDKYRESSELRSVSTTQPIVSGLLGVLTQLLKSELNDTADETMEEATSTGATGKQALLESFTRFYSVCSPRSTLFRMCTSFVISYLTTTKPWPAWAEVLDWMQCFAKLLGHLENIYMELARQCLSVMISVMKQLPSELAESDRMEAIMSNLITFFDVPAAKEGRMSSRFDDLAPVDQIEFIALVYHLPHYPVTLVRALTGCCKSTRVTSPAKSFLIDILFQRREALDIAHLVSFLMSSALNTTVLYEGELAGELAYKEHLELVHHVCRVFRNMNLGASLLKILRPALSRQSSDQSSAHLHTLILLYRTCLLSAAPLGDSLSSDLVKVDPEAATIAADMEKTLVRLLTKGLIETFVQRTSGSLGVEQLKMMENDFVATLEICVTRILVHVSRALMEPSGDSETVTRNLRVLQSLTRSPRLTVLVARRRKDIAELLPSLDGLQANEEATRLVRQLRGDLELVAVGRS